MTTVVLAVLFAVCCLGYAAAATMLRRRGDRWPHRRDAAFWAGGAVAVVATAAPWPWPGLPFTRHMAAHLGIGMVAPLLLVLGRPVTLALRTLPVGPRRGLLRLLRSRPLALLVRPQVAAPVHAVGLWVLYRTRLPTGTTGHHGAGAPAVFVQLHLLLSGALFTFAVLALDPVRHRAGYAVRWAALFAASAAHGILAKSLYVTGPPGTSWAAADLRLAARVMYYGGDVVGIALAVLLAHQWYAARGRALRRYRYRDRAGDRAGGVARAAPD